MTPKLADGYLFIPAWGLFIGEQLSHSPSAERRGKGTLKEGEPLDKGGKKEVNVRRLLNFHHGGH
jgi:hypothetical protein